MSAAINKRTPKAILSIAASLLVSGLMTAQASGEYDLVLPAPLTGGGSIETTIDEDPSDLGSGCCDEISLSVHAVQRGNRNILMTQQDRFGSGNLISAEQNGQDQSLIVDQTGNDNLALLEQDGSLNSLELTQFGQDNALKAEQSGHGLSLKLTQYGTSALVIRQRNF
jgi:hypothetical protein